MTKLVKYDGNGGYVDYDGGGTRCALIYCNSIYIKYSVNLHNISFFGFPKDSVRCYLWVESCNPKFLPTTDLNELSKKYKLCSKHFEDQMFSNFQKNRLFHHAMPTLFKNIDTITCAQTSIVESSNFTISDVRSIKIEPSEHCYPPDLTISHYYSMADMSTLNNIDSNSMCDQTSNSLSIKSPWKLNEEIQSKELKTSISNLSEVSKPNWHTVHESSPKLLEQPKSNGDEFVYKVNGCDQKNVTDVTFPLLNKDHTYSLPVNIKRNSSPKSNLVTKTHHKIIDHTYAAYQKFYKISQERYQEPLDNEWFMCAECPTAYADKQLLINHQRSMHKIPDNSLKLTCIQKQKTSHSQNSAEGA